MSNALGFRRPSETVIATTPSGAQYVRVPVAGVHELHRDTRRGDRPARLNGRIFTYRARHDEVDIPISQGCLSLVLMPCGDSTLPDGYRAAADTAARLTGKDRLLVRVNGSVQMIQPHEMGFPTFRGAQIVHRAVAPRTQAA
ncbi:MAG: hypothetical protein ACR2M1_05235 [Gemmatimonadaceae bacterium]